MQLNRVNYNELNAKQKENYNFHKVDAALAEYGYNSMRLNDDWQGADFIAVKGDEMLKIQLKGRFTVDEKYRGKDIYITFIEDDKIKMYKHDEAVNLLPEKTKNTESWAKRGGYSWGKTPKQYDKIITEL
mgnify:CR=1 FL=1